jgi:hypothetical protein
MGFVAFCIFIQTSAITGNYAQASIVTKSNIAKVEIIKNAYQTFKTNIDYELVTVEEAAQKFSMEMFDKNVSEKDMADFVKKYSSSEDDYNSYVLSIEEAKANLNGEDFTSEEFSSIAANSLSSLDQDALRWSGCASLGVGIVLLVGAVTMGIIALVKSKGESKVRKIYAEKKQEIIQDHQDQVYFINNAETEIPNAINANFGIIYSNQAAIDQAQFEVDQLQLSLFNPDLTQDQINSIRSSINIISSRITSYQANIRVSIENINYLENELVNYQTVPGYADAQLVIESENYANNLEQNEIELEARIGDIPQEQRRARTLGIAAGVSAIIGTVLTMNGAQDC